MVELPSWVVVWLIGWVSTIVFLIRLEEPNGSKTKGWLSWQGGLVIFAGLVLWVLYLMVVIPDIMNDNMRGFRKRGMVKKK